MLNFKRCKRPTHEALATFGSNGGLHGYGRQLPDHLAHWKEQKARKDNLQDLVIGDFASGMVSDLSAIIMDLSTPELALQRPDRYEGYRRDALNHLALSILMQHLFSGETTIEDMRALGELPDNACPILPEPTYDNDNKMPYKTRVHVAPEIADAALQAYPQSNPPSVWYRANDLYVQRTRPAQPTDSYIAQITFEEVPIPPSAFADMHTLFPYLAART